MGRTSATAADIVSAPNPPEITTSAFLADILTLEMVEMISEAAARHEKNHRGRERAPILSALRGTVREIRALHELAPIDWGTGEPRPVASDNVVAMISEAAEVTS